MRTILMEVLASPSKTYLENVIGFNFELKLHEVLSQGSSYWIEKPNEVILKITTF